MIQCLKQSGNPAQIRLLQCQVPRSALRQHLPDPFPLLLLALSGFSHLCPKIVRIKDEAVEQELRNDVAAAMAALISPNAKHRGAATGRTSLEDDRRIELLLAGSALTLALGYHVQRTVAPRATIADQHHTIEEPTGLRPEGLHRFGQLTGQNADVHRLALRA
jgi:hypothetical protein